MLDHDALHSLPEDGHLPATLIESTVQPNLNVGSQPTGPSTSSMSDESSFIRPSVLTLGSDDRTSTERLAAACGGAHHVHMKLGQPVKMHTKKQWKV